MPIDYNKYNKGFRKRSRYIRFVRALNRCENCGAANYQTHPYQKLQFEVILATAHLNHDRRDDSEENLRALCQFCHLKHDLEHNIYLKKYGKNYHERQLLIPNFRQLPIHFKHYTNERIPIKLRESNVLQMVQGFRTGTKSMDSIPRSTRFEQVSMF